MSRGRDVGISCLFVAALWAPLPSCYRPLYICATVKYFCCPAIAREALEALITDLSALLDEVNRAATIAGRSGDDHLFEAVDLSAELRFP